jgi:hypothetical protein
MILTHILFVTVFSIWPFTEAACKCANDITLEEEVKQTDLIFSGTVVGKEIIAITTDGQVIRFIKYKVKLDKLYKGRNQSQLIFLSTTASPASCGLSLEMRQHYIVFAHKGSFLPEKQKSRLTKVDKNGFWINSCSKTNYFTKSFEKEIRAITQ